MDSNTKKVRMRNLFDRWNIGTVTLMFFIKCLQALKKLGFKAEENGWRKASCVFFRHEHSKFCLGSFRLNYLSTTPAEKATSLEEAKPILKKRLSEFLRQTPSCHWQVQSHRFRVHRKKLEFFDIIEAEFNDEGLLQQLIPYFDSAQNDFPLLSTNLRENIINEIIQAYNKFRDIDDTKRHRILSRHLRKTFYHRYLPISQFNHEVKLFIERILSAAYIHFETMPATEANLEASRLATPHFENRKHPGAGLINICCRFTHDFKEADLWMQYHHAPVDGTPMQQTITDLRNQWGTVGPMHFPALNSPNAKTEISHFGDDVYRGRLFVDFSKLLKVRKKINQELSQEMGGSATLASMLIWGIAHFEQYKNNKYVLPVDRSDSVSHHYENNLSLVLIRPGKYISENNKEGFIKFQQAFNLHLQKTRQGRCEMTEFMDLIALNHPAMFSILKYLMPKALGEVIGTVCFSIIKEAEVFVAPLSDLQVNGFIAIGSCKIPTKDNNYAGSISICGKKDQVEGYIEALQDVTDHFEKYI